MCCGAYRLETSRRTTYGAPNQYHFPQERVAATAGEDERIEKKSGVKYTNQAQGYKGAL